MSTISVILVTLTPLIDIASAPANLNSFIKSSKSLDFIFSSLLSVNVTITPSPVTLVFPSNKFDCNNSSSNSSDDSWLSCIFLLYSDILLFVSVNFSLVSSYLLFHVDNFSLNSVSLIFFISDSLTCCTVLNCMHNIVAKNIHTINIVTDIAILGLLRFNFIFTLLFSLGLFL